MFKTETLRRKRNTDSNVLFCYIVICFYERVNIGIDVVTGKPAPFSFQLAVPPTTCVPIQNMNDLTSTKRKTSRAIVLRLIIVHGQNVFWHETHGFIGAGTHRT